MTDRPAHDDLLLIEAGHAAGDLLDAPSWRVVERGGGVLVVEVDLPEGLKNPAGQLFGGFTSTYVDLVSIFTVHTRDDSPPKGERPFLTTINMRCDYFEPIVGPSFRIRGEHVNARGRNHLVSTRFLQGDQTAAYAITTLREMPGSL